ncbi:protocatechuate 3,4-dioxygenase subunit beta [Promicromonospora sp. Populi]|uniref:protocatechuate 3,4-dioxygenase subunit beta n=1 Tax=Promicromonospora sp. Populi TaxID=3239420 RepID=UPI0034E2AA1D
MTDTERDAVPDSAPSSLPDSVPSSAPSSAPDARLDAAAESQAQLSAEIEAGHEAYEKGLAQGAPEQFGPRLDWAPYRSSLLRHPTKDLHHADPETIELFAPVFGERDIGALEADLTVQHNGEPIGERIVVRGRVVDGQGRPVRRQLVEVWQANAAGRYVHKRDQHPAPVDPNFTGVGRMLTDDDGWYQFQTIKPGPYPWKNHFNAWRPAHIHFSLFGREITQRIVTQMYFPGDPLFALDPIYQSIQDARARDRLVATYDHDVSQHEWATGYRWDIVLSGAHRTWTEPEDSDE